MKNKQDEELVEGKIIEDTQEVDEEEPDLEDVVLGDSQLDLSQVQNLSHQSTSPVLDTVAVAPHVIGLEHGIANEPAHTPVEEDTSDPFKYNIRGGKDDETKYVSSDAQIRTSPERVDAVNIGRVDPIRPNQNIPNNQGAFFTSTHNKNNGNEGIEKYTMPENQDIDSAGRNQFKKTDMKYDPKLPKH